MCMERVKLNSSACKFYCCPVTQTLLYTLLYLHFFNSYQLERGKNTAFPEGTAKTPFSTRTGKKKKIARKMSGRQSNSFLLSKLPICEEGQLLRKAMDGRTHEMKKMPASHRHSQHFH